MDIIISTIFQGLIYSVLGMGVFIAFRILNFADMTAEGSFTLGGSICAVMILHGVHPAISIVVAGLFGTLAGFFTGFLNTKLKHRLKIIIFKEIFINIRNENYSVFLYIM